jgi:lipopolysaccharide export system permease protein
VVADQLPLSLTMRLVACQMPRILLFTLPMSALFGTVQTFSDLSTRGELTALSVGGMSLPRMIRAPLVLGVILALLAFWMQEDVVPRSERKYKEVVHEGMLNASASQTDFLLVDSPGNRVQRVVQADYFDPKSRLLAHPSIQIWNDKREIALEITANSARWDLASGKWIFYEGTSKVTPPSKGKETVFSTVTNFTQLQVDVLPNPKAFAATTMDINEQLEKRNYELLSISNLRAYLRKQPQLIEAATYPSIKEKIANRMRSLEYAIHDKIATPLICIAVILIAAPLGVRPQRSGNGFAMGLSLATLLVYYIVWTWASEIGKAGILNPYLMAYLPLLLTLGIGGVLMKLKSR